MKTILFANTDWYLYNFRFPLAKALRDEGYEPLLLSPLGPYVQRIKDAGFQWEEVNVSRRGINPFKELGTIIDLIRLYRQENVEIVHHFTIKCVLYGSFAARWSDVKHVINAVTGLGFIFSTSNLFTKIARPLVKRLYKWLLEGTRVIFQNQRDMEFFIRNQMADEENCVLIAGSGVDVEKFKPSSRTRKKSLVILPARMLWDKGIKEFVEAVKIIRQSDAKTCFALVGDVDAGNPSSIPRSQLEEWQGYGLIEWWGWQDDMLSVYQSASIVCLPSYGEGLAKSLIEAAACGKPLIASDIPGCREVVEHGVNGLLVPKGNAQALADALMELLPDKKRMDRMGEASRKIVVEDFSTKRIVVETLSVYNYVKLSQREI